METIQNRRRTPLQYAIKRSSSARHVESIQAAQGPFKCTPCGKEFKLIYNLISHMRFVRKQELISTSDRSQQIDITGEQLELSSSAQPESSQQTLPVTFDLDVDKDRSNHLQTRGGFDTEAVVKSYSSARNKCSCRVCRKRFASVQSLERHVRTIHLRENKFSRSVCGYTFGLKHNLKRHTFSQHS